MMENKDAGLDIYSGNSKPEQQRELVSSLEVGQLLEGRANKETSDTEAEGIVFLDDFRGDTLQLIAAMRALVELDKEGCLRPHGIGGHASSLLVCSSIRLETLRAKVAELEAEKSEVYRELSTLAKSIFRSYFFDRTDDYKSGHVVWECCDDSIGVTTQLDNMMAGLRNDNTELEAENAKLKAALREALESMVDAKSCMQGVIENDYTPDSFTTQPYIRAITTINAALGETE